MAERSQLPRHNLRDLAFDFVKAELGLSQDELASPRRKAHLVAGRALFVWIVKSLGGNTVSYSEIGRWLGDRDHSTIEHLFNAKAPQLRQRDSDFALQCERFALRFLETMETDHGDTRH